MACIHHRLFPSAPRSIPRSVGFPFLSAVAFFAFSFIVSPGIRCEAAPADGEAVTYSNPVIFADYSDPDVVRVNDDFYMVSSSFHCVPGLPVLHSRDLVHWRIVSHALPSLPSPAFDRPQHGNGVWAPSIRYHNGEFWIYYGDPDRGIILVKSARAEGPWESPFLVKEAEGWIDPCPLWDDDGAMYLVHAWAKSRAGFNSILTIHRMSPDGRSVLDTGAVLFDGRPDHPTIEGPKFYKREGFYYIFAPAGGVKSGWQTVLRSRSVFGPYDDRVVLAQGSTSINGPHQGAWVETPGGESWFVHFQDRGPFGRIVHLQPVRWSDGWPVMGVDSDGDGVGEPVLRWPVPLVVVPPEQFVLQTSDEFKGPKLGLQWQWQANQRSGWASLTARPGVLRFWAVPYPPGVSNLWGLPNLLLQKLPGPSCIATASVLVTELRIGEEAGLVVLGRDYAALTCSRQDEGLLLESSRCQEADAGTPESREFAGYIQNSHVYMRLTVDSAATCQFSVSDDGVLFTPVGDPVAAREGKWVGARMGVYCSAPAPAVDYGFAEIDWFRVEQ